MALDLADYEKKSREAAMAFWGNREKARQKQIEAGTTDQGERAGVTGGKNMDGFIALVIDLVKANGLHHAAIHKNRAVLTLPGYFRPTKLGDLLVLNEGRLVAAIELKSQVGPPSETTSTTGQRKPSGPRTICGPHTGKELSVSIRALLWRG